MNFEIIATPNFKKEAKNLSKKYTSLRTELPELIEQLIINPEMGTALGDNIYKIRLAIKSKGKGKSGGARVITFLKIIASKVYLVSIYDKSEKENLSDKELKNMIKDL